MEDSKLPPPSHAPPSLQGDEFAETLAGSQLLKCDRLDALRLVQCGLTCEGVTLMAKAFESVGECWGGLLGWSVSAGVERKCCPSNGQVWGDQVCEDKTRGCAWLSAGTAWEGGLMGCPCLGLSSPSSLQA